VIPKTQEKAIGSLADRIATFSPTATPDRRRARAIVNDNACTWP